MSYSPTTVLERVFERARQRPEAIALRRCDAKSSLRYGELVTEVNRLATTLRAQSVSPGSRVLVISDNGPETYLSVLACAKLGAIAVMADGNLPPATVDRFGQITSPAAILVAAGSRIGSSALPEGLQAIPTTTVDLTAGPQSAAVPSDFETDRSQGAEDPLAMIFTSGTTGEPKAVLLANRTFFAIPDILREAGLNWVTWVDGETTYSPLPATHIGGLWWIFTCLMRGGTCITGGENTTSLMEILNTNEVATTCLVPTLLSKLVSELKSSGGKVPSLRLVGYGGSRAIAADVRYIEATGVATAQVYGLSETGCTALCLPTDDGSIAKIEAGAVGRPYPGVECYLAGPDGLNGKGPDAPGAAPSASFGTLWIKSPANMLGYWNNPARTQEVLVDGWVNTGDLLERHDDGFFYIKGRSSEMFISGGVNIAPDEVDRIAEGVPGVREAACYEIPDAEFGALVGLAVVPSTDLDESAPRKLKQAIAAHFRQQSESAARPSTIVIVAEIPRTQSGKVMRASLAATVKGVSARG